MNIIETTRKVTQLFLLHLEIPLTILGAAVGLDNEWLLYPLLNS